MPLIQWNSSLSVNIEEVDAQHQVLVQLLNNLFDSLQLGKGKEVIEVIIKELVKYTEVHFKFEENYFDNYHYPDTDNHKVEHVAFVKQIKDFQNEYDSGKVTLTVDVLKFLRNWLQNHIQISDKKYSPFLNQKGVY